MAKKVAVQVNDPRMASIGVPINPNARGSSKKDVAYRVSAGVHFFQLLFWLAVLALIVYLIWFREYNLLDLLKR